MTTQRNHGALVPRGYRAYLIRLWREGSQDTWRASAQSVETGTVIRFASLDALFDFLISQTVKSDSDGHPSNSGE